MLVGLGRVQGAGAGAPTGALGVTATDDDRGAPDPLRERHALAAMPSKTYPEVLRLLISPK